MAEKIDAFVLRGANDASIEQVPMPPAPGPHDVLLRTLNVGICGSDVHYWATGQCGTFIVREPMILGHETSAVVEAVGLATEPAVPCERCSYCRSGVYNLCPDIACHATPPYHGTLVKYFLHRAAYAFKVPDSVDNEEAAMIEPLSVAVHSCKRSGVTVGSRVLITGAGPIGIYTLMAARAYGATRVVLTDINEERLKLARELGADQTILVTKELSEEELVAKVKEAFGDGEQPDISLECSGAPSCSRLVLLATKSGGVAIQVGLGPPNVSLPIADAAIREVTILGAFRYKDCFPTAVAMAASGKLNLKALASHRFDFKDCLEAYKVAKSGAGMKVIIKVTE
ncbi:hypothetical protein TYRP_022993 [Tyrophagus putrescentiae]|nr:hypothetical protein TYRP_022993 [Tyrophagus putrescentiae]